MANLVGIFEADPQKIVQSDVKGDCDIEFELFVGNSSRFSRCCVPFQQRVAVWSPARSLFRSEPPIPDLKFAARSLRWQGDLFTSGQRAHPRTFGLRS